MTIDLPQALLLALGSYLLGSIPFALLLGKLKGVDIRKVGSGNIGATNLSRALGRGWGISAFLLDFLKGFAPVLAPGILASDSGGAILLVHAKILCALAAILGHVFPVYLGFRGGKGVATTFGAVAALAWAASLAAGAVWLALFLTTRIVSVASIASAVAFPVAMAVVCWKSPAEVFAPLVVLAAVLAALIIFRHRSNIRRLFAKEEKRF